MAVEAAEQSLELSMNQTAAYQNEFTEVDLLRQRMDASVLLIKALGGGWDLSKLPPA